MFSNFLPFLMKEQLTKLSIKNKEESDKEKFEQLLKHKFFVTQVNYPPQNGFLEYGPVMTVLKNEMINCWKQTVVDENMLELDTSVMVPYDVLKNSGHIDRFCDVVLTDGTVTVRADHFIEEKVGEWHLLPKSLSMADFVKLEEIKNILKIDKNKQFEINLVEEICAHFDCESKNLADCTKLEIDFIVKLNNLKGDSGDFLPAKDFNLIFKLNDGQYMRPEIAQGIFVNFKKAYEFNNGQMPFACFSIGKSYRNEISARGGMFRTKEFYQAEIEYFTEDGSHENFNDENIQAQKLLFLPNTAKTAIELTVKEAVKNGIISSEAICVFLVRTHWFLKEIGIDLQKVRYRQHHCNEMAHYASDCWDLEIHTLSGWIECAGIAHRGNFDLTVHSKAINTFVRKSIKPLKVKELKIEKKKVIKVLKERFAAFEEFVSMIDKSTFENKDSYVVTFEGRNYELPVVEKTIDSVSYIPTVIEPSFGMSRILYALLEQKFIVEESRKVLKLKPKLCFRQVVVAPLLNQQTLILKAKEIKNILVKGGLYAVVNLRNVSIGKKYLTSDEIGIPFVVTVDKETEEKNMVTVRNRDNTEQIQLELNKLEDVLIKLINEKVNWETVYSKYKFK
ncbi:Glycine--tRNA [Ecytonucleospora hepatopenaei]|uniref:glycine--tRNA ligase n=1 Tax=Ecytonucleospora hepatopenaei TaxID=646526 RepID=A0A1W0E406_9MICR|nr:Glycine--tRNA [Ecytonucleospora hepatopenaei]